MRLIYWILAFVLLIAGCSSTPIEQANAPINQSFTFGYYNGAFKKTEDREFDESLKFVFPAIPGSIFGSPSNNIVQISEPDNSKVFTLNLAANLDYRASPLLVEGLTISPADTEIFRLSTFHFYGHYENTLGGGGFVHKTKESYLLLIYVTNPAVIRGVVTHGADTFHHNLKLESSGWNWIEMTREGNPYFTVSAYKGTLEDYEYAVVL